MKVDSSNSYKSEHMKKESLQREILLPVSLVCSEKAITKAKKTLKRLNMQQ